MLKRLNYSNIKGKKVLLRVDINSPVSNKKIIESPRIIDSAKTIKKLLDSNVKLVIIAHQGRKGDRDFLPLDQHAKLLSKYSKHKIKYIPDLFGRRALEEIFNLKNGQGILLQNVRDFDDEKEVNDKSNRYIEFSRLFEIYINEAFSDSHRAHGSIVIPPKFLKSYVGPNFQKEIESINHFSVKKNGKSIYIIGGAKIEDYFPLFNVLKDKNSIILATGVLANLIHVSQGRNLGYENKWLKNEGYLKLIPKIKDIYNKHKQQIILPVDFAIDKNGREEHSIKEFPLDSKIFDIGKESTQIFIDQLQDAKAVFMKGPVGFSEIKKFSYGTVEILKEISRLTRLNKIFSLLGGGHLSTSIKEYKIKNNFSHISTAGGALIAYISGEKMPGLEALR
jgi:phosphoglycerate kinase